jgi:hypothetical protein
MAGHIVNWRGIRTSKANVRDRLIEAGPACVLHAQSIEATPPYSLGFKEIIKHPLVQQELRQQADDLKFLGSLPQDVSQKTIRHMRNKSVRRISEA